MQLFAVTELKQNTTDDVEPYWEHVTEEPTTLSPEAQQRLETYFNTSPEDEFGAILGDILGLTSDWQLSDWEQYHINSGTMGVCFEFTNPSYDEPKAYRVNF